MVLRIAKETFIRRKRQVGLVLMAVIVGASITSALLTVYGNVSARMSQELRSFGANILVRPKSGGVDLEVGGINYTPPEARILIDERELPKIETIFWKNNITGFAPFLSAVVTANGQPVVLTGTWFEKTLSIPDLAPKQFANRAASPPGKGTFVTGIKKISPWWQVEGKWVEEGQKDTAIVGSALAKKLGLSPGDSLTLKYNEKALALKVAGILSTGGLEENQVFVNLDVVQQLLGSPYGVDRVLVSALVTPSDKVAAEIRGKKPEEMTPQEYELWYCTPLVESIAFQIEEVVTGVEAGPIRQISEAESSFVSKTELLVLLITAIGVGGSIIGVVAAMTTMVMQRRKDIGLMKAIGAQGSQVAWIFFLEAGIIGLVGGLLGYGVGLALAQFVGRGVFGMPFSFNAVALPLTILIAVSVALAGSIVPVRRAVRVEPVELLREAG